MYARCKVIKFHGGLALFVHKVCATVLPAKQCKSDLTLCPSADRRNGSH
jgi:hypothetical protein